MKYLLDTNVVSELARDRPSPLVQDWIAARPVADLFVSDVTLAEIRHGIHVSTVSQRQRYLALWLEREIRPFFRDRTLPTTEDILFQWRIVAVSAQKRGRTLAQPDALIAACAIVHGLTVATRDTHPYGIAGVQVVNPWSDPAPRRD